jgi:hypothetical protein
MFLEQDEQEVVYPTTPDENGWYYNDAGEKELEIETRQDEDGNTNKRVKLSGGRVAIVKELTGKENKKAKVIAGKDKELFMPAVVALSTTITDKNGKTVAFVAEDLDGWKAKDVNRLTAATSVLNF